MLATSGLDNDTCIFYDLVTTSVASCLGCVPSYTQSRALRSCGVKKYATEIPGPGLRSTLPKSPGALRSGPLRTGRTEPRVAPRARLATNHRHLVGRAHPQRARPRFAERPCATYAIWPVSAASRSRWCVAPSRGKKRHARRLRALNARGARGRVWWGRRLPRTQALGNKKPASAGTQDIRNG